MPVEFDRFFSIYSLFEESSFGVVIEGAPASSLDPVVFGEELLEIRPSLRV